jgi:predicted dehydrogenase
LRALGWSNFILYRTGKSTLPDLDAEIDGIPTFYDLDSALAENPIAVVIANPTAAHIDVALAAARAGSHLFLEKPISDTLQGVDELKNLVDAKHLAVLVGFQFRYHPTLMAIKNIIQRGDIGQITSAAAHWGEYLPAWHPWEDYKTSYAARPELGGGVVLTLCHPFDYLRWLVGEITQVSAALGYNGGLDIPVEDTADVTLKFVNGATGHVHLDYVQRPPSHTLRITGDKGLILWDNADGGTKVYRADAGVWEVLTPPQGFERNALFMTQTEHFLACIRGDQTPACTLHDGIRALEIALEIKRI